jgi:hypothetical protein
MINEQGRRISRPERPALPLFATHNPVLAARRTMTSLVAALRVDGDGRINDMLGQTKTGMLCRCHASF